MKKKFLLPIVNLLIFSSPLFSCSNNNNNNNGENELVNYKNISVEYDKDIIDVEILDKAAIGAKVSLNIKLKEGKENYTIKSIKMNDTPISINKSKNEFSSTFTMPDKDVVIKIEVGINEYPISFTNSIENVSVSTSKINNNNVASPDEVIIIYVENNNKAINITGIKVNNDLATKNSDGTYQFVMPNQEVKLTILYEDDIHNITSEASEGFNLNLSKNKAVFGNIIDVQLTYDINNYVFKKIYGIYNNEEFSLNSKGNNEYSFVMKDGDVKIVVEGNKVTSANREYYGTFIGRNFGYYSNNFDSPRSLIIQKDGSFTFYNGTTDYNGQIDTTLENLNNYKVIAKNSDLKEASLLITYKEDAISLKVTIDNNSTYLFLARDIDSTKLNFYKIDSYSHGLIELISSDKTKKYYSYLDINDVLHPFVNLEFSSGNSISNNSIFYILENNKKIAYIKVSNVDQTSYKNIILGDLYKGTYKYNNEDYILDGFGNFTKGENIGTYTINYGVLSLTIDNTTNRFLIDLDNLSLTPYTYSGIVNEDSKFSGSFTQDKKDYQVLIYFRANNYLSFSLEVFSNNYWVSLVNTNTIYTYTNNNVTYKINIDGIDYDINMDLVVSGSQKSFVINSNLDTYQIKDLKLSYSAF